MNDTRKIEVLRKELERYKELAENLKKDNDKLSETVNILTLEEEERQKKYNDHNLEYDKMKAALGKAFRELNSYKAKYTALAGELSNMRKHYKEENERVLGKIKSQ